MSELPEEFAAAVGTTITKVANALAQGKLLVVESAAIRTDIIYSVEQHGAQHSL